MKIPKKITPCPIVEAIVEVRFNSDLPQDAIFGVIYNEFKNEYKTLKKLPILQLPEEIRSKDPNLKHQPYYRLVQNNFILQIGPSVLSLVNIKNYLGWEKFSEQILKTFSKVKDLSIISSAHRLGVRYINFFELNIIDNINLKFLLRNHPFSARQIIFKSTLETGNYLTNLQILNNGEISVNEMHKLGSVIDIDTYIEKKDEDIFPEFVSLLEDGHSEEKKLFFSLLDDSFLKKFNPEY